MKAEEVNEENFEPWESELNGDSSPTHFPSVVVAEAEEVNGTIIEQKKDSGSITYQSPSSQVEKRAKSSATTDATVVTDSTNDNGENEVRQTVKVESTRPS